MASSAIPIKIAERIAKTYGYKQVIILAWTEGTQWQTTYGIDKEHCKQAAEGAERINRLLKENSNG